MSRASRKRPLAELVDEDVLASANPAKLRAALPRGWVPDEDGVSARRDLRLFFRESWVLLSGLIFFGAAGIGLFWSTFPRGWTGVTRALVLVGALIVIGGIVAPLVTRALSAHRR